MDSHSIASSYESGELLGELLAQWEIFGDVLEGDDQGRQELVVAILEEGLPFDPKDLVDYPDYNDLFTPRWEEAWDLAETWTYLIRQLIEGKRKPEWRRRVERFMSKIAGQAPRVEWPGDEQLEFAIEDLGVEYSGANELFRARCHRETGQVDRYTLRDLSAPSAEKTRAARANRKGHPALYMATDEATAVAEVRPWKHAAVAVARMRLGESTRILDLTNLAPMGSPFASANLKWTIEARNLLGRFAEELSRPVSPNDEATDYLPSQLICDAVRRAGFKGIVYPSAVSEGKNVVLFNPAAATPQDIRYVRVRSANYTFANMTETEPVKDSPWL